MNGKNKERAATFKNRLHACLQQNPLNRLPSITNNPTLQSKWLQKWITSFMQTKHHTCSSFNTQITPVWLSEQFSRRREKETEGNDCYKFMLRVYQWELNDSVWPEGITLHQEAHFYTTPPLPYTTPCHTHSSVHKITSLSISICFETCGISRGSEQAEADSGGQNFSSESHLKIIWEGEGGGNWWRARIKVQTVPNRPFLSNTHKKKRNVWTSSPNERARQDERGGTRQKLIKQKREANGARVSSATS